jgi:hypothetical protein
MKRNVSLPLAILITLSACSGSEPQTQGAVDPGVYQASLGVDRADVKATSASMSAVPALWVFNQSGGGLYHHLEIWNPNLTPVDLSPGKTYLGGPGSNGRGTFEDNLGPDLTLVRHADETWVDVLVYREADQSWETADRVELQTQATTKPGWSRLTYRAFRAASNEPFAVGSFITPQESGEVMFPTPTEGQM